MKTVVLYPLVFLITSLLLKIFEVFETQIAKNFTGFFIRTLESQTVQMFFHFVTDMYQLDSGVLVVMCKPSYIVSLGEYVAPGQLVNDVTCHSVMEPH